MPKADRTPRPPTRKNPLTKTRPECCRRVIPGNAAQAWSKPASILKKPDVRALLDGSPQAGILEVGAGALRNALHLLKEGFRVHVFDPLAAACRFPGRYREFEKLGGKVLQKLPSRPTYEIILTTYVIETICCPHERRELVRRIAHCLMRGGFWILSVRGPRNIVLVQRKSERCSDGYLTSQRTFVRSYTKAQLEEFLRSNGFKYLKFLHGPSLEEPELLDVIARKAKNE